MGALPAEKPGHETRPYVGGHEPLHALPRGDDGDGSRRKRLSKMSSLYMSHQFPQFDSQYGKRVHSATVTVLGVLNSYSVHVLSTNIV
jgi:hypothetical protein